MSYINRIKKAVPTVNKTDLIEKIRKLPEEAITRMRNYQSEIGCGNCCADCSQLALPQLWSLKADDLDDITDSIAEVASEIAKKRGLDNAIAHDRETRPDTIFPYFDNDLGSSPLLPKLLDNIHKKFGKKSKFTTISWSRHNKELQKMHESINKNQIDTLVAVSFSLTSYTKSWRQATEFTSRKEYVLDLANALKTYRPAIDQLGGGKESGCVTLRFKPMVSSFDKEMDDIEIDGYHVLHTGPFLLVGKTQGIPRVSQIDFSNRQMNFSEGLAPYLLMTSNTFSQDDNWLKRAKEAVGQLKDNTEVKSIDQVKVENTSLVKLSNQEGEYYATDPIFQPNGTFKGKYFYHKTEARPRSGFNDSERYFLNTLIEYKESLGLSPLDKIPNASWSEVKKVMDNLSNKAKRLSEFNSESAEYIKKEVIPLVNSLIDSLKLAGYEASYFFDPGFNVDTGQILNQGRAISDFKGLTKIPNLATNPQHLRVISTWNPKTVWRWTLATPINANTAVNKNINFNQTGLFVQELNSCDLSPYSNDGTKLREYFIEIPLEYDHVGSRSEFIRQKRIPGLKAN